MSSVNNSLDIPVFSLDDLKARFEVYEEGVRGSYLFVSVKPLLLSFDNLELG
jgi:hypothetical protein